MKFLIAIVVVVLSNIFIYPSCEGFESNTFQELGKIRKISIDVHTYKTKLTADTLVTHDKLALDLNGLIDTIVDEIGTGKESVHEEDFQDINKGLRSLQQKFQDDIELFHSQERHARAYEAPLIITFLIIEGIPFILKQIESWQNDKKNLKKERIDLLKKYKWTFVLPS